MSHDVGAADPSPLEEQLVINCRAISPSYHVCLLLKTFGEYIGFCIGKQSAWIWSFKYHPISSQFCSPEAWHGMTGFYTQLFHWLLSCQLLCFHLEHGVILLAHLCFSKNSALCSCSRATVFIFLIAIKTNATAVKAFTSCQVVPHIFKQTRTLQTIPYFISLWHPFLLTACFKGHVWLK